MIFRFINIFKRDVYKRQAATVQSIESLDKDLIYNAGDEVSIKVNFNQLVSIIGAVSYTHLDVYKRQR